MSATTPHPRVRGVIVADLRRAPNPDYALFQAAAGAPPNSLIRIRVGSVRPSPWGSHLAYLRGHEIEIEADDAPTLAGWLEYVAKGLADARRVDARDRGWSSGIH